MKVINWFFRNRRTGEFTIVQFPNLALWVYLAVTVAKFLLDTNGDLRTGLKMVSTAALLWWSGDELARGVNPFRNVLGGVVLAVTLVGLVSRI